jgi:hypothetical protein
VESLVQIVVVPLLLIAAFYWPGRLILRVLTGGRYPPPDKAHDVELVAMIAIAAMLIGLAAYYQ